MFRSNLKCKDYLWVVLKTISYENMGSFVFHFHYRG